MILTLFILGIFFTFAALCGLLIYGYRSRAHSAEARANRAEGALGETRDENYYLRGLAEKAIRYAGEAADIKQADMNEALGRERAVASLHCTCLSESQPSSARCPDCGYLRERGSVREFNKARGYQFDPASSYTPQTVAFCPACNVSVRHPPESFPVPCPSCSTLIDPVLDNPPEL